MFCHKKRINTRKIYNTRYTVRYNHNFNNTILPKLAYNFCMFYWLTYGARQDFRPCRHVLTVTYKMSDFFVGNHKNKSTFIRLLNINHKQGRQLLQNCRDWPKMSLTCIHVPDSYQVVPEVTACILFSIRPVFIVCTALFLSELTVHCLMHGFLDTHLLIHSWCNIARNWVSTVIGRSDQTFTLLNSNSQQMLAHHQKVISAFSGLYHLPSATSHK